MTVSMNNMRLLYGAKVMTKIEIPILFYVLRQVLLMKCICLFDIIYVMTRGGSIATEVMAYLHVQNSSLEVSNSYTLHQLLAILIISIIVTTIVLHFLRRVERDADFN